MPLRSIMLASNVQPSHLTRPEWKVGTVRYYCLVKVLLLDVFPETIFFFLQEHWASNDYFRKCIVRVY